MNEKRLVGLATPGKGQDTILEMIDMLYAVGGKLPSKDVVIEVCRQNNVEPTDEFLNTCMSKVETYQNERNKTN